MRKEMDFTALPPETVVRYLDKRVATGDVVLHGSTRNSLYLQPRPGRDLLRESGCYTAIYATTSVGTTLRSAIYNRPLALRVATLIEDVEVTFMGDIGQETHFAFMPHIYPAVVEDRLRPTDLLCDGYVFEGQKSDFKPNPSSAADWFRKDAFIPTATYKVSRRLGHLLFGNLTSRFRTRPYTTEECQRWRGLIAEQQPR